MATAKEAERKTENKISLNFSITLEGCDGANPFLLTDLLSNDILPTYLGVILGALIPSCCLLLVINVLQGICHFTTIH